MQHRYNGLVYPCGNQAALTAAILTLTDDSLRKTYGRRALEIFSGQDLNCELNAFLTLFKRIKQSFVAAEASQSEATTLPNGLAT